MRNPALAELEAALTARLAPQPTAAERRVAELFFLTRLLDEAAATVVGVDVDAATASPPATPKDAEDAPSVVVADDELASEEGASLTICQPGRGRVARSVYEARQPVEAEAAPTAAQLVERYGSWQRACRAAAGLLADGRSTGPGHPWAQPLRGRSAPRYTRDDVHVAIRRCALDLGRLPSAGDYHWWSREQKRLARARGSDESRDGTDHPLIPGIAVVYRYYRRAGIHASRWRAALAEIGITERDLADARLKRLGVAPEEAGAGIGNRVHEEDALRDLPFADAVVLARERGCSLDWLVGHAASPGVPPPEGTTFSAARLVEERKSRGVSDRRLREALGFQLGPWRRLLKGEIEPVLSQVAAIARVLGVVVDQLHKAPQPEPPEDE